MTSQAALLILTLINLVPPVLQELGFADENRRSGLSTERQPLILPQGERILLRLDESVRTGDAQVGDSCRMVLAHDLIVSTDPGWAVPAGSEVIATIDKSASRGLFRRPRLEFRFGLIRSASGREMDFPVRTARVSGPVFREGGQLVLGSETWVEVEVNRDWVIPPGADFLADWSPDRCALHVGRSEVELAEVSLIAEPRTAKDLGLDVLEERGPETPRFVAQVDRVRLEALVRDDKGLPIEGLDRNDLELFEDGAEREIAEFGADTRPLAAAILLDASGSIAPFKKELRAATLQALDQLSEDDRACLFFFSDKVTREVDLTGDRELLADKAAKVAARGRTNIFDAVFNASHYLLQAAQGMQHAIILISDNMVTEIGRCGEGGALRMAMNSDSVIYSLRLPGALPLTDNPSLKDWVGDSETVERMTRKTGGEIIELSETRSLSLALEAIIRRLKRRYFISFLPQGAPEVGFRSLSLRLGPRFGREGRDYTVKTREGYFSMSVTTSKPLP